MVTVQQVIDSLSKFPADAPFEIAIEQYNQRYPVAYVNPQESPFSSEKSFATMLNGQHVRMTVTLPYDGEKYMMTSTRKMK